MRLSTLIVSLVLIISGDHAFGLHNITIDDTNTTAIIYTPSGSWDPSASHTSGFDYNGSHSLSENSDSTAQAAFTFTGVAIYYMSPLWPYPVDSAISVDSGPQEIIDLMDHSRPAQNGGEESVPSQAVWGRSGLTNGSHTVVVALHSNYIVVDAFIYTVLDADDSSSSSSLSSSATSLSSSASSLSSTSSSTDRSVASSTTSSSSTTNTHTSSHSSTHIVAITVGCIAGALAVTVIIIVFLWCCRRRKKNHISSSSPILDDSPLQPNTNIWPGNNTAYERPWADQMAMPPGPLASPGASYTRSHMTEAIGDFDPIATRRPRPPPSGVRTLSTISESSRSSHPAASLLPPQATSFNNGPAEMGMGYRTSGVEGTERLSSVASNTTSRTPSSYQSAESNGAQRGFVNGKELELSWERSQNPLQRSPPPYYREG